MGNIRLTKKRHNHFTFRYMIMLGLIMVGLIGCSGIKLVADYDENIDKGISSLQKKTEKLLLTIESKEGTAEASYDNNKNFYEEAKIEISSLRIRADAIHRNSLTVRMLDKLLKNIKRLESDHQEGITKAEVPLYRGGLNSQFTAILSFELAKKRGKTPDEKESSAPPTAPNK